MENFRIEFLQFVLGAASLAWWAAAWLFAGTGIVYRISGQVKKRDKESTRTPYDFSLSFFFKDNFPRLINTIITCFIFLRFFNELTGNQIQITMLFTFFIGMGSDSLGEFISSIDIVEFFKKFRNQKP